MGTGEKDRIGKILVKSAFVVKGYQNSFAIRIMLKAKILIVLCYNIVIT